MLIWRSVGVLCPRALARTVQTRNLQPGTLLSLGVSVNLGPKKPNKHADHALACKHGVSPSILVHSVCIYAINHAASLTIPLLLAPAPHQRRTSAKIDRTPAAGISSPLGPKQNKLKSTPEHARTNTLTCRLQTLQREG